MIDLYHHHETYDILFTIKMDQKSKIYVAGHRGLVGSALLRALQKDGYKNLITRTRQELDLLNGSAVTDFFKREKPEFVLYAAAKVGGIGANNTYPADFIYQNLAIQNNVIHNSYLNGVKKLYSWAVFAFILNLPNNRSKKIHS